MMTSAPSHSFFCGRFSLSSTHERREREKRERREREKGKREGEMREIEWAVRDMTMRRKEGTEEREEREERRSCGGEWWAITETLRICFSRVLCAK